MDVRRFGAHYRSPALHGQARAREVYETYYDIKYPNHERQAGRPLRVSPAYDWHARARRGVRREVGLGAGELVRRPTTAAGDEARCARAAGPGSHWSPAIGAEHAACREAAALFDETSFAKIEVSGPGAAELLEQLCDNRVAREVGRITYTQMLNARGGIECDFTVSRLAEDRFGIVTGTAFGRHDLRLDPRALPADGRRRARWRTSRRAGRASACGGRGRATCWRGATTDDLDFPYMRWRELAVGDVPVRALRVTYVGELGWELYCPMEYGARCGGRCGRPARRTAWWRAATGRSTRCGSRRATASGAPTSRPTRRRTRAASASACKPTRSSSAARRSTAPSPARRLCCLVLADPRVGGAGQRARARRRGDRRPRHQRRLRLHGRDARSPTRTCRPSTPRRARRWPSRSSASGSTARLPPSRSAIPRAPESATERIGSKHVDR